MFNVINVGNRIELDYVMKPSGTWPEASDIRKIVKTIHDVTGIKFNILLTPEFFVHYAVSLFYTVITNKTFETGNKHICLFLRSATK